ncbi:MAG: alkaline phosphatase D family protein [Thiolinea sp.]
MKSDNHRSSASHQPPLEPILCGPILRHVSPEQVVIWLVCSTDTTLHLQVYEEGQTEPLGEARFAAGHDGHVRLGEQAHLHLLVFEPEQPLTADNWLSYDLRLQADEQQDTEAVSSEAAGQPPNLQALIPDLCYEGQTRPDFIIKPQIDNLLHGSCRKPHHRDRDGMQLVDDVLEQARQQRSKQAEQPALLMLTGDQIYADDVAGPMLSAIQQIVERLGLFDEALEGINQAPRCGRDLINSPKNLYGRTELLPDTKANAALHERFFAGARKPIFTSASADNHLITLAEMLGMYLLVWSPSLWQQVDLEQGLQQVSSDEERERYQTELGYVRDFVAGLPKIRRALAHVPVYMIFDDHDVTDDWNLNRGWEESAYGQSFSRRIIGNAMIAYLLCQGWGNAPQHFSKDLLDQIRELLAEDDQHKHDELVNELLRFTGWQYTLKTHPKLVVLDTRTRRWRSESNAGQPSGLMDWEALLELQQELLDEKAVLLVSSAPIFGVKLIEVVQRIFTWFGYALTVDAENWMAHPGAANVILNIFRYPRTPQTFVILSGDVHYSFAYDVRLKRRDESPRIWQITCSGIKSTFPERLLRWFDRLNRWLFASYSPLNWLTQRRHMRIRSRRPDKHEGRYQHQRLLNGNGIGRVRLDEQGEPVVIEVLWVDGQQIGFTEGYDWDWH